ncbi:dynamin family protein [Sphaerisporangium sp. NBC_01403]|uniref:dynamin family protein n=1 Tax=Sphaerisporangium sp. NBC_01403 TaxID=2903599 RepID=UPI003243C644
MADEENTGVLREIARLREKAERLHSALSSHPFPDEPGVSSLRERVEQLVVDQINLAKNPVTIGVVGQFSVGKSMMLGTLLGKPDLLPTEQRPTTGNVTALTLLAARPGQRTHVEGTVGVHYLSRQQLINCVGEIMGQLVHETDKIIAADEVAPLDGYNPIDQGWIKFERWCQKHLWGEKHVNPTLRKTAQELLTLRDAHLSAEALLGETVHVSKDHIDRAIDLGASDGVPESYPERDVRPGMGRRDVEQRQEDLRLTFPLIRRVAYTVRVDPRVWALDGLRDQNEVVLLDFPGLAADRSAKRDAFLSESELRDIHTIITVIDAPTPETEVPDRFYNMLERHGRKPAELRDSVLAVGNRFDRITPPDLPGDRTHVTMEDLWQESQNLRGLCVRAPDLVQKQAGRVRLVSSAVAMSLCDLPATFRGQEMAKVAAAVEEAPARAAAWKDLAARVLGTQPGNVWGRALEALAEDGGFASLRDLIEDHARTHGLANKLRAMRRLERLIGDELPKLKRFVTASGQPPPGGSAAARERVGALFTELRRHHGELLRAVGEFRNPLTVRDADGVPLVQAVREAAVTETMCWPQWQEILRRAQGGFVRKNQEQQRSRADRLLRAKAAQGDDTTAAFVEPFATTYADAVKNGHARLSAILGEWLDAQNARLAPLRERFLDDEVQRLLDVGLPRIAHRVGDNVDQVLDMLTEVSWLASPEEGEDVGADPEDARGPQDGTDVQDPAGERLPVYVDRALPWHPRVPEGRNDWEQKLARHQIYLFRLRRAMALSVADAATEAITTRITRVHAELRQDLEYLYERIPGRAHVNLMFPAEPQPGEAAGEAADATPGDESPLMKLIREWGVA